MAAPEPDRRRPGAPGVLRARGPPDGDRASGRCRPTPPSSSATPRSTGSASSSPSCRRTSSTSTGRTSPSPRRSRPVHGPAGEGDGEAALRRRRRQRPLAGAVPDGGGDHRDDRRPPRGVRRRPRASSRTTTRGAPRRTTGCFVDAFRAGAIPGISSSGSHPEPGRRSMSMPTCGPMPGLSNSLGDDGEAHPLVEPGGGHAGVAPDEVAAAGGDPRQPVDDQRAPGAGPADGGVGRHPAQLPRGAGASGRHGQGAGEKRTTPTTAPSAVRAARWNVAGSSSPAQVISPPFGRRTAPRRA